MAGVTRGYTTIQGELRRTAEKEKRIGDGHEHGTDAAGRAIPHDRSAQPTPQPDFPNRLKFCGIGLGVGLALGLIVAGGFEFMDDRLHSEKEIKALLPMKVISEIPRSDSCG